MVLLKNDPVEGAGTLLPLSAKAKKVALIGPLADDARDLLGAWSAGDPKNVITLKQELSERLGDKLLYALKAAACFLAKMKRFFRPSPSEDP